MIFLKYKNKNEQMTKIIVDSNSNKDDFKFIYLKVR